MRRTKVLFWWKEICCINYMHYSSSESNARCESEGTGESHILSAYDRAAHSSMSNDWSCLLLRFPSLLSVRSSSVASWRPSGEFKKQRHAHTMSTCTVGQTAHETRSDSSSLRLLSYACLIHHHHLYRSNWRSSSILSGGRRRRRRRIIYAVSMRVHPSLPISTILFALSTSVSKIWPR